MILALLLYGGLTLAGPASLPIDAGPAGATEPNAGFGLEEALALMRQGHPLRDVVAAQADAAAADTVIARLWENPVLGLDYFLGVRQSSYDRAGSLVVGVSQWLPVSALPRHRRRAATQEREAVADDNRRVLQALELAVEASMLRLAAAALAVEIRRDALADLEESRRIVTARVEAGVAPRYDATRIALAMSEAEALVRVAEAEVIEARADLDVAVGPLADQLHGAPRIAVFEAPPLPSLASLHEEMLAERPDLSAARARSRAAASRITVARREVFPGIGLRIAAGYGQGPQQVDVGAGVSIPLPVLSRGQGLVDRARAEARAAEGTSRTLALAAEQRLAAAYRAVLGRREASQRYVELGKDAADALQRQAEAGYRDGRLSVLELTDASLSVRDMRLRDLELALQARLAELELRRLVKVGGE